MKLTIIAILIMTCVHLQAKHQKMDLQKALDSRLVMAKAYSLGGYQGNCIKMELKNLTNDSLFVTVEAGRRLNSLEESDQDILITQEQIIVLKKSEGKSFPVTGFCCQANNHSPRQNAKYGINRMADSNLVILARYMSTRKFDQHVIQQAVWAISDKRPTAQITNSNDSSLLPLRMLVSTLKGEPLPWFTVISRTLEYPSGAMENFPIALRGKMNYTNGAECYTTLHVLNSKGIEVCQVIKQWTMPGTKDYDLDIPLKGLAKGKYIIELNSPDKNLAKKEFEI
jgi:hypothetical protein